jgi:hypothetical protein
MKFFVHTLVMSINKINFDSEFECQNLDYKLKSEFVHFVISKFFSIGTLII